MRLLPPRHTEPRLRLDADRYAPLFAESTENFTRLLTPWRHEFAWPVGRTNNGTFESVDVELYHAILRTYRPKRVVEVGGGHSSRFSIEALRLNGQGGTVMLIDPRPRVRVPKLVQHVARRVEDVDVGVFLALERNDVLFIDSSHTTGEARYHVDEILPHLASGVVVHHHDILFPYDKYYLGDRTAYGEPDVVLDFYLAHGDAYEVLVGAAYVAWTDRALVERLVDSYRWQAGRIPGSLWARAR